MSYRKASTGFGDAFLTSHLVVKASDNSRLPILNGNGLCALLHAGKAYHFSSRYEVKGNGKVIQMHSFPILKDVKMNFDRKSNAVKIYDVRISDELLFRFLYRYYTVNVFSD